MKKILLAAVALIGLTGAAFAEDPMKADRSGAYVTGSVNGSDWTKNKIDLGAAAGYQVVPYARVELDVDHAWRVPPHAAICDVGSFHDEVAQQLPL